MDRPPVVKTTRITIETETLMIVRHGKAGRGWCPDCRAEVNLITMDDNGIVDQSTSARIRDWLAAGKLNSWHLATGPVQICFTSLLKCFKSAEAQRAIRSIDDQSDEIRRKQ